MPTHGDLGVSHGSPGTNKSSLQSQIFLGMCGMDNGLRKIEPTRSKMDQLQMFVRFSALIRLEEGSSKLSKNRDLDGPECQDLEQLELAGPLGRDIAEERTDCEICQQQGGPQQWDWAVSLNGSSKRR